MAEPAPLQTAGEHATARVPVARPGDTAGAVRSAIAGAAYDSADDVAVLDGRRLVGIVPIETLIAADPGAGIVELMDADPPVVTPDADQERVALAFPSPTRTAAWRPYEGR
jgi:magnesium transporter